MKSKFQVLQKENAQIETSSSKINYIPKRFTSSAPVSLKKNIKLYPRSIENKKKRYFSRLQPNQKSNKMDTVQATDQRMGIQLQNRKQNKMDMAQQTAIVNQLVKNVAYATKRFMQWKKSKQTRSFIISCASNAVCAIVH